MQVADVPGAHRIFIALLGVRAHFSRGIGRTRTGRSFKWQRSGVLAGRFNGGDKWPPPCKMYKRHESDASKAQASIC